MAKQYPLISLGTPVYFGSTEIGAAQPAPPATKGYVDSVLGLNFLPPGEYHPKYAEEGDSYFNTKHDVIFIYINQQWVQLIGNDNQSILDPLTKLDQDAPVIQLEMFKGEE